MGRDIVVHYDEATGEVTCCTVDDALTTPLRARELPMTVSIPLLAKKGVEEAERAFGAAIFALIDLHAKTKIGLRDYQAIADRWTEQRLQDERAGQRATSTFESVLELVSEGLRKKSRSTMENADRLLRAAAAQGDPKAKEYLEDLWPALKSRSDKTFK